MGVVRRGAGISAQLGGIRTVRPIPPKGLGVLMTKAIERLVRRHRPIVVQTYLGRATRLTRVPRESHTIHVARLGGYYGARSYRHADAWVGNTAAVCDHLRNLGFPSDRVFCISLGRFVEKKGFADLLDAFARLLTLEKGRRFVLILAGDGPDRRSLQKRALQLGIGEHVRWPGWVQHPGPFFRAADVFVCPSRQEPPGNVILEAWFHGAPVVATRSDGPAELITDGEDGLLAPVADPGGLADRIRDGLRSGEEALGALAAKGRRTVAEHHGAAAVVGAYLDLYDRLPRLGRLRP